jgi:thymidylate synthase
MCSTLVSKDDRTGTALSVFRLSDALRSQQRFPAADDQKVHLKSIIHELLWFLQGQYQRSVFA